ncbi:MAG: DEAD/DEAH box helicase [Acidimicrobiales bacterium]|nr:DEAD/DEAH box helicase [Acidimicrobiales bacterium]
MTFTEHLDTSGTTFVTLGIPVELTQELARKQITTPTPIQRAAIPPALAARDVCGKAKTGSGKTLAFGLPLLATIGPGAAQQPAAIVLVPTRELAVQVRDALEPLGRAVSRRVVAVYGGTSVRVQADLVATSVAVVVATPGRLIDLIERDAIDLSALTAVVIDEADRMADMGFLPQVEWILRRTTGRKQTMLFSATLDGEVDVLINRYLNEPVRVEVTGIAPTVASMRHFFLKVHEMDRDKVVAAIAKGVTRTIVFCATKRACDRVARSLHGLGIEAAAIHGDLRQRDRERALARFSEGKHAVLVATDVAARGIHVDEVDAVVHYDPSDDHKSYLHRSGRTARAGASGFAVTLLLWNQELEVRRLKRRLQLEALPIIEVFSNDTRLGDLHAFARQLEASQA